MPTPERLAVELSYFKLDSPNAPAVPCRGKKLFPRLNLHRGDDRREATGNLARLLLLSGLDHDAEQLLGT